MPNIDMSGVQESSGGFEQLEPGGYVCRITRVEPHPEREYAFFEWDVAEGPHARHFEGSEWPPRDVVSWKGKAVGMTKHKLHVLADANPGKLTPKLAADGSFAGVEEFDRDEWSRFIGLSFGAVVRRRLYTKKTGETGEGIEIGAWKSPEEIRAGDFKPMAARDSRELPQQVKAATAPAAAGSDVYDEDIPF